jgi:hypothetical protein
METSLVKENGSYSLGRTSFWITFVIFIIYLCAGLSGYIHNIFWISDVNNHIDMVDIPESLVQMLLILLGYNLGKKAVFAFEKSAEVKYTNASYSPQKSGYYNAGYVHPQNISQPPFTSGYMNANINNSSTPEGVTTAESSKFTADINYEDKNNA